MHMMMRRPMRFIPGDLILERDTFGIEISSTLREQVRACLGERQVGARWVHRDVAVIDRGSDCRHVLVNVAAGAEELLVIAPTWSLPAWSGSIPFAIASSLLTAASSLASGRSSLYFMERAPAGSNGVLLHDLISVGREIQKDGLGDMSALIRRDPFIVQVRTPVAFGVLNERGVDSIGDQDLYCVSHSCLPSPRRKTSTLFKSQRSCSPPVNGTATAGVRVGFNFYPGAKKAARRRRIPRWPENRSVQEYYTTCIPGVPTSRHG